MRCVGVLAVVVGLAACSGGGGNAAATTTTATTTSTTTLQAPANCPSTFKLGQDSGADPSCWPAMLDAALAAENVGYDRALGQAQAAAICSRFDTTDATQAALSVLADWETGAAPSPVTNKTDQPTFLVMAVGVYCPKYAEAMKAIH